MIIRRLITVALVSLLALLFLASPQQKPKAMGCEVVVIDVFVDPNPDFGRKAYAPAFCITTWYQEYCEGFAVDNVWWTYDCYDA